MHFNNVAHLVNKSTTAKRKHIAHFKNRVALLSSVDRPGHIRGGRDDTNVEVVGTDPICIIGDLFIDSDTWLVNVVNVLYPVQGQRCCK